MGRRRRQVSAPPRQGSAEGRVTARMRALAFVFPDSVRLH